MNLPFRLSPRDWAAVVNRVSLGRKFGLTAAFLFCK
jgi:hypothetical protein